jgi:glycosyltransferase involved in cell wall biosynthesis
MSAAPLPIPTVALIAHQVHDHGGMERAFLELIRRSAGRVRFIVVSSVLAEELRPLVEWHRIRVPQRPFPLRYFLFFVAAGVTVARIRGRATIVHSLGAIVPNRVDVATVQFCHTGYQAELGRLAPPGAPLARRVNTGISRLIGLVVERWCYRPGHVAVLAPVSLSTQREIAAHFGGVRSVVTPNGVDLERFRPRPELRSELRAELGTPDDTVVALFVGGDWGRKGLAETIQGVASACRQASSPLELWVVGRGDSVRFSTLARAAGVETRVRFLGTQQATERYYAAADLLVLPTLYETFSLVAYEAAAAGLPIVATRVSGIDELLDGEGAGLVVDRDPASIGDAVARLANDPGLRRQLGAEGRRRANGYGWNRSVESVLGIYRTFAPSLNGASA